jgi:energy-coupling factor transporter ATP-binding protein EcfA2
MQSGVWWIMSETPREHPLAVVDAADFADFDTLVEGLARWAGSQPDWPPARRVAAEWEAIAPRLDRARRELSRVLVVGVIGGTGTGKSTLVNALAGAEVTAAGDVARPTTVSPVVVTAADVDLSWLPVADMQARVVRSGSPAVANIVLIDCPDPDTQADAAPDSTDRRPSAANRNRDLLEQVLPVCDVLLLVATVQKYRSWIVAREVASFAPGRPLLFVQTHASRDPDIRADWRRELEHQGFVVPRIFRLDAVDAAARAAAGLEPDPGFRELLTAIDGELVGRAARRVRRTGSLDLVDWFARQAQSQLAEFIPSVAALDEGVVRERTRLEGILARGVTSRLVAGRSAWQRLIADEVLDRWHGGPFATFLHVIAAIGSLWHRMRPSGGVVGRLLAGQPVDVAAGRGGWQSVEELGLPSAEVEQSRSVLSGLAGRASVGEPLVGRSRLSPASLPATIDDVVGRTGAWLASGIDRLVASRRGRLGSRVVHWTFEVLFSSLVVFVLVRAGWSFFYGNLWQGQPVSGIGFLQEAIIWVILWGLVLRWVVLVLVRAGLDRDIGVLVSRLPEAGLVDPFLADFASAADGLGEYLDDGARLAAKAESLARATAEPTGLGRLAPRDAGRVGA